MKNTYASKKTDFPRFVGLLLSAFALGSCAPSNDMAATDELGYNTGNCRAAAAKATEFTNYIVTAFQVGTQKGYIPLSELNLDNVQRLVCMANDESTFGGDKNSLFVGAFQLSGNTYPAFCGRSADVLSHQGNTTCALRILFDQSREPTRSGGPRWGKWPRSSDACRAGTAIRQRCFDSVVASAVDARCPAGIELCNNPKICNAAIESLPGAPQPGEPDTPVYRLQVSVSERCPVTAIIFGLTDVTGKAGFEQQQKLPVRTESGKKLAVFEMPPGASLKSNLAHAQFKVFKATKVLHSTLPMPLRN